MKDLRPNHWLIATFNAPVIFSRGKSETWYLNPTRRYVFSADHLAKISEYVETTSTLSGSSLYRPLTAGAPLQGTRILVERFRDRGLGDHLFLTGPFAFIQHISGHTAKIHVYAFTDRAQVFLNSPDLEHRAAFVGPTHYDDFRYYDYQWMVASVTESSQEADQLNVYDALYASMGLDPGQVPPKFKRPYLTVDSAEQESAANFFYTVWAERQFDLRKEGYYVVAPLTHSPLRAAPYGFWLELCDTLSRRRPVIVIGQLHEALPDLDMPAAEFVAKLNQLDPRVVNLLNPAQALPLRSVMALIAQANCLVTLDTGPLYIAQGLRTPAVSIWGPHDPGVRIGYDPDYMDLAVWQDKFCRRSPCFCFGSFPVQKCPRGEQQQFCEVLYSTTVDDVLTALEKVECRQYRLAPFSPKPT